MAKPANTDAYILSFPPDVQSRLQQMRAAIKEAAPEATELISYSMPAFKIYGLMLVWYGAHTNHIGLYPRASAIEAFAGQLTAYQHAKGSVQLPFNEPMPVDLIKAMVKFRVEENVRKKMRK